MDSRVKPMAEEFVNRGLTHGQALMEAYTSRRSYLMAHPFMSAPKVLNAAVEFARDVLWEMDELRSTERSQRDAPTPDGAGPGEAGA